MEFITTDTLASYLRDPSIDLDDLDLIVDLTNGIVSAALGEPDETDEPTSLQMAVAFEVGARAWRNPGGYSSETVDDYTYRLPPEARRAGVYITASELEDLLGTTAPSVRMGWLA